MIQPDFVAGTLANKAKFTPTALEEHRKNGISDDLIADDIAKTDGQFRSRLQQVRQKYRNSPQAVSAFLNWSAYGDAKGASVQEEPEPSPITAPFSNAQYGAGNSNPITNAVGFAGNAIAEVGSMVNPLNLPKNLKATQDTIIGAGKLAGKAFLKTVDATMGTKTFDDLKQIVDRHPEEQTDFAKALRGIVNGDEQTTAVRDLLRTYGVDKRGIHIADPNNPDADTMVRGFFEHPLLPALIIGGAIERSPMSKPIDDTISNVKQGAKDVAGNLPGVKQVKQYFKARGEEMAANEAYKMEIAKPKTALDVAKPKLVGREIDIAAEKGTLIEDPKTGEVIGSKETPRQQAIASELEKIPNFNPQNPGSSIRSAKLQIKNLSEQAELELQKQSPKGQPRIKHLESKEYQSARVKELRKVLSDETATADNRLQFSNTGELDVQQKVNNIIEEHFSEQLRQLGGDENIAGLRTRRWIDDKLPSSSYQKDFAELPAKDRALMVASDAINAWLDNKAKSVGGAYADYMHRMNLLFDGIKSMKTHLPNRALTPEERFTLPKEKLPNKVRPGVKDAVVNTAKNLGKKALGGAAIGAGMSEFIHP